LALPNNGTEGMNEANNTDGRNGRKKSHLAHLADIKLGLKREEAAFLLGSVQLFDEMIKAKWVLPVVNRHKLQLFDRGQISRAWVRILNGEQPPRLVRLHE
jgi:hypothetical protein